VDGAIVDLKIEDDQVKFSTIADEEPIGLTGSGLLSTVFEFRNVGVIDASGRILPEPPQLADRITTDAHGTRAIKLTDDGKLLLTQHDIRELQKAKGAIRAAIDVLMQQLNLTPSDLQKVILTGSFGGQVDVNSIIEIGMIPPVRKDIVETTANGAGFGAAMFLTDEGFALGEKLAAESKQVDLDLDANFNMFYIEGMSLVPDGKR
jgi:uncharacterized 2Fe-2S/4Fe-4S cluster protein (DUF4445 family)